MTSVGIGGKGEGGERIAGADLVEASVGRRVAVRTRRNMRSRRSRLVFLARVLEEEER